MDNERLIDIDSFFSIYFLEIGFVFNFVIFQGDIIFSYMNFMPSRLLTIVLVRLVRVFEFTFVKLFYVENIVTLIVLHHVFH